MNADLNSIISILENGIKLLKDNECTLQQEANIFRAIGSISTARAEKVRIEITLREIV